MRIFSHPMSYFYPRSPCGERRCGTSAIPWLRNFYPRSPCGERLRSSPLHQLESTISIHALLAESDGGDLLNSFGKIIFLSTLSLRRATLGRGVVVRRTLFLSTLSLRRATSVLWVIHAKSRISIHALLAESDFGKSTYHVFGINFYPRSPCGERQTRSERTNRDIAFLSTLSLRRATVAPVLAVGSA